DRAGQGVAGGRHGRGQAAGRPPGHVIETEAAPAPDLGAVFRDEAGRLTAGLVRWLGDFDLAEESAQEALIEALEHWPRDGMPERPGAWLAAVGRRKAIDRVRREARYREKLAALEARPGEPYTGPDDRLRR